MDNRGRNLVNKNELAPQEDNVENEGEEKDENEKEPDELTQTFLGMRAWQTEMKLRKTPSAEEQFSQAKKNFMVECTKRYPNEINAVDKDQPGTEIVKSRQALEALEEIPNLEAELKKTARNIRVESIDDPVTLIMEIDRVFEPSSRAVQELLLSAKLEGKEHELDACFRELFRLEILRESLEARLSPEERQKLEKARKGGTEPAPGETKEEFKVRIEQEVEENWDRLFKEQYQMSLDEWFIKNMPHHPDWTKFKDAETWKILQGKLRQLKFDWMADKRMVKEKEFDYKIRLNEILNEL